MSKLNFKPLIIATGILLAMLSIGAPLLSVTSIAIGLFLYIHSTRRAARLEPVKVSRYE